MRRIDARRGTENFKALFPTEFELLTKNHQGGPKGPPIRSRVNEFDISQNFNLFHVSNLFVINFKFFLLMYPVSVVAGGGTVPRLARRRAVQNKRAGPPLALPLNQTGRRRSAVTVCLPNST